MEYDDDELMEFLALDYLDLVQIKEFTTNLNSIPPTLLYSTITT